MSKRNVVKYVDGIKITVCAPRAPRISERTFPISKSRYTAWAQGVTNYEYGVKSCQGTIEKE